MLDPKPNCSDTTKRTWEDLNNHLKAMFSCSQLPRNRHTMININDYDIPEDELLKELSDKGFTFEKSGDTIRMS